MSALGDKVEAITGNVAFSYIPILTATSPGGLIDRMVSSR